MARFIESLAGFATTPGATLTGITMATGDVSTLRNAPAPARVLLISAVRGGATAADALIMSANMHDDVKGVHFFAKSAIEPMAALERVPEQMVSGDALTLQVAGGAAETDALSLSLYYDNVNQGGARLASPGDIQGLIKHVKALELDLTTTATGSAWKDVAINTTEDQFKANHDYALLGFLCDHDVMMLGIKGSDTGNVRNAVSGQVSLHDRSEAYVERSLRTGLPCIPIFNANNKASVLICAYDFGGATAVKVSPIIADLGGPVNL